MSLTRLLQLEEKLDLEHVRVRVYLFGSTRNDVRYVVRVGRRQSSRAGTAVETHGQAVGDALLRSCAYVYV